MTFVTQPLTEEGRAERREIPEDTAEPPPHLCLHFHEEDTEFSRLHHSPVLAAKCCS